MAKHKRELVKRYIVVMDSERHDIEHPKLAACVALDFHVTPYRLQLVDNPDIREWRRQYQALGFRKWIDKSFDGHVVFSTQELAINKSIGTCLARVKEAHRDVLRAEKDLNTVYELQDRHREWMELAS